MPAPLPSAAGVGRFLAELKRRKVYRTTAAYAAGAFIVWQAADIAFPAFGLPATAMPSAAERFEAALSLDPDWVVALSGLAELRYAEGDLEQAERHLLEVMKSHDHSPGDENLADWVLARYRLARIHDERGDLDTARERYNEFLALWGRGDRDVPEIASARERLEILGRRPRVGVR